MTFITACTAKITLTLRRTWLFARALRTLKDLSFLMSMCVSSAVTVLVFYLILRAFTTQTWLSPVIKQNWLLGIIVFMAALMPLYLVREDVYEGMRKRSEASFLTRLRALAPWRGDADLRDFISYAKTHTRHQVPLHTVIALTRQELLPKDRQQVLIDLLQQDMSMSDYVENVFIRASASDIFDINPEGKQLQRLLADQIRKEESPAGLAQFVTIWAQRRESNKLLLVVDNTKMIAS